MSKLEEYHEFRKEILEPLPADQLKEVGERVETGLEVTPEKILGQLSFELSLLANSAAKLMGMIEMAREKGINIDSELGGITQNLDYLNLNGGNVPVSLIDLDVRLKKLLWELRKKVANDPESFGKLLRQTEEIEKEIAEERKVFLEGGED